VVSPNENEDCLTLNVWTPDANLTKSYPVMLFIHGGSFKTGSGSLWIYDGTNFTKNNEVVLVTINYRLGAFGFITKDIFGTGGNNGLRD